MVCDLSDRAGTLRLSTPCGERDIGTMATPMSSPDLPASRVSRLPRAFSPSRIEPCHLRSAEPGRGGPTPSIGARFRPQSGARTLDGLGVLGRPPDGGSFAAPFSRGGTYSSRFVFPRRQLRVRTTERGVIPAPNIG